MSNSVSDDTTRPTVTRVEGQPDANTAIAAFVSELQQRWDYRDTAISNRHVAADVAWGSPYGAIVHDHGGILRNGTLRPGSPRRGMVAGRKPEHADQTRRCRLTRWIWHKRVKSMSADREPVFDERKTGTMAAKETTP